MSLGQIMFKARMLLFIPPVEHFEDSIPALKWHSKILLVRIAAISNRYTELSTNTILLWKCVPAHNHNKPEMQSWDLFAITFQMTTHRNILCVSKQCLAAMHTKATSRNTWRKIWQRRDQELACTFFSTTLCYFCSAWKSWLLSSWQVNEVMTSVMHSVGSTCCAW